MRAAGSAALRRRPGPRRCAGTRGGAGDRQDRPCSSSCAPAHRCPGAVRDRRRGRAGPAVRRAAEPPAARCSTAWARCRRSSAARSPARSRSPRPRAPTRSSPTPPRSPCSRPRRRSARCSCWSTTPTGSTTRPPPRCCSRPAAWTASGWRSCSRCARSRAARASSAASSSCRCTASRSPRRASCCATGASRPASLMRLHTATAGNPLALLEAARHLPEEQLRGRDPLGDPLPVGPAVQVAFRRRLDRLPPSTRIAMLVVTAAGADPLARLADAGADLGVGVTDLEPAEADELIELRSGEVRFRHPLVRAAAYQDASAPERRAVHRALAAHTEGARRANHLWAAATGPDEQAATELEAAARTARERTGFTAAALALERAARLTVPGDARAWRLLGAAQDRLMGGDAGRAVELASEALRRRDRDSAARRAAGPDRHHGDARRLARRRLPDAVRGRRVDRRHPPGARGVDAGQRRAHVLSRRSRPARARHHGARVRARAARRRAHGADRRDPARGRAHHLRSRPRGRRAGAARALAGRARRARARPRGAASDRPAAVHGLARALRRGGRVRRAGGGDGGGDRRRRGAAAAARRSARDRSAPRRLGAGPGAGERGAAARRGDRPADPAFAAAGHARAAGRRDGPRGRVPPGGGRGARVLAPGGAALHQRLHRGRARAARARARARRRAPSSTSTPRPGCAPSTGSSTRA